MILILTIGLVQWIAIASTVVVEEVWTSGVVVSSRISTRLIVARSAIGRRRNFILLLLVIADKVVESHTRSAVANWRTFFRFYVAHFRFISFVFESMQFNYIKARRWTREPFWLRIFVFLVWACFVLVRFLCHRSVVRRLCLVESSAARRHVILDVSRVPFVVAVSFARSYLLVHRWLASFSET